MNSTALEAILDVAIGMIFMWLILSVATMSVQEWIASYLKWRAKDLETAIRRLLGNNQLWAEQLYAHPLIQGLSKKLGAKPSYIPANKFALALADVVLTAGTEQSFIQQQLLAAKREIDKAPDQLLPFIGYLFKRFGKYIGTLTHNISYFFGSDRGVPEQKFEDLLKLTQKLFHESHSAALGELQDKLKEFFLGVISDTTTLDNGKQVSISSADFLNAYPSFRSSILGLLNIILENQPNLKLRWAEIVVYNDKKLIEKVERELKENETLREKLHELVLQKAENFDLNRENIESIISSIRQTLDEINFLPVVNYIQELIGTKQGMEAVQSLNPPLYKSLSQLQDDIIGIANTPGILEAVRTRFAIAAANLGQAEHKLATLRLNAETWFNESMDRLSGWYKRKATLLAFVIGLVLAGFLNVDSIVLAEHLWKEPAVRQALVANATKFVEDNPELPESLGGDSPQDAVSYFRSQFSELEVPLGWKFTNMQLEPGQSCSLIPIGKNAIWGISAEVPESQLETNVVQEFASGAETQQETTAPTCQQVSNFPKTVAGVGLKILGIILSAVAAAQGAPFWFDILKKVVNIRGSGANPDEKSK
jgi:hypothetical protein